MTSPSSQRDNMQNCAGEKGTSMLQFSKERVIDLRWGDKDQLPNWSYDTKQSYNDISTEREVQIQLLKDTIKYSKKPGMLITYSC